MATAFEYLCLVWFLISTISGFYVAVMFYIRRSIYPITAVPVIWPILTHLGAPLSVYSYLFKFIYKLIGTGCYGLNAAFVSSLGYFPAVPAFEVQLVHLWYIYYSQTAQLKANAAGAGAAKGGAAGLSSAQKRRNGLLYTWGMYVVMYVVAIQSPVTTLMDYYDNNVDEATCQGKSAAAVYSQIVTPFIVCSIILYTGYIIRHVEEEFELKKQFKILTLLVFLLGIPFRVINMFISVVIIQDLERILFACIYFGYTVICGFYPLYLTYKEEKRQLAARKSSSKLGSRREDLGAVFSIKSISQLRTVISHPKNEPVIIQFKDYLIKEFCCENILFAIAVLKFRQARSSSEMLRLAQQIGEIYLLPAASMEINISSTLKTVIKDKLRALTEQNVDKDFFEKVELQVYQMLLDPFNRFLTRQGISREAVAMDGGGEATQSTTSVAQTKLIAFESQNDDDLPASNRLNLTGSKKVAPS